jgi:beta-lactamase regulating signal transducer with metallopeptidase domain
MIAQVLDHLWQSTVILCLAGVLTLLLRKNGAGARYWLWFAASVKFLIPLALLTALASRLLPIPVVLAPVLAEPASGLARRVSQPFAQGPSFPNVSAVAPAALPALDFSTALLIIWSVGCGVVLLSWFIRWTRLRRTLLSARPLSLEAPIPLRESRSPMEPGLVGIWRPVVLLPAGLADRLAPAEIRGILAHELCHYSRRDNLTSAVHMLVEALFWFYPPIWWLGARLIAERERACDEAVLAAGNEAEVYAESILKVCRFFRHSALACTAGVSGADLRRRVEEIMSGRSTLPVGRAKRLLVSVSIAGALIGMALFGGLSVPAAQAQTSNSAAPSAAERARLLAEQTQPQKEVPFNPADFDKFVGYYRLSNPMAFAHVFRNGAHYYVQLTGQQPVENFPESPTEFFATVTAAQVSFVSDPSGQVTEMILHQNGLLRPWPRSSKSANDAFEAELQQRIRDDKPSPGTEASLRRFITSWEEKGRPNYDDMEPGLAEAAREQAPQTARIIRQLGAFESLKFNGVTPLGIDTYLGTFAHGEVGFWIAPLDANGKVVGRGWRLLP